MTEYFQASIFKRRPVRNLEGFISAYKLWNLNEPIGMITERTGVSDRTVTNWVNMFKDALKEAPPEKVLLDRPFQSSELRKFEDFDWSQLLDMLELVREYEDKRKVTPTYRQAFWSIRLSHSFPKTRGQRKYIPLFNLTDKFVNHEIEELHGQPTTLTSTELSEALEEAVR